MEQICRFSTVVSVTARVSGQPVQWVSFNNYASGVAFNPGATAVTFTLLVRNTADTVTRQLYDSTGAAITVTVPANGATKLPDDVFACTELGFQVGLGTVPFTLTLKG